MDVIFLESQDAGVVDVVRKCIADNKPILINRLPAVVDCLGEEYPFYFDSLEDACNKLCDEKLISDTYEYLKIRKV